MKARSTDEKDAALFKGLLHDVNREILAMAQDEDARRAHLENAGFEKSVAGLHEGRMHVKTLSFSGYEENPFYRNMGGGRFMEIGGAIGLSRLEDGRGLAAADLDGDGDADLVLRNVFEPALLYFRNDVGTERPSIEVRLRGVKSNRFGIGARVTLDGRTQEMACGEGYLSCGPPALTFGLGDLKHARRMKIVWPSGSVQLVEDLKPGVTTVTEGGEAVWTAFRTAARPAAAGGSRPVHAGETVELALRSTEGAQASTSGKWCVLCVWSAVCRSCVEEVKLFGAFAAALRGRGGEFFAVNVDDDVEEVKAIVREQGFVVPVWLGRERRDRLLNPHEPLVPTTLIIDPAGRLVARHIGTLSIADLERILDAAGAARVERSEFETYAEQVRNSSNQYYGTLQIPQYEQQLASPDPRKVFLAHAFLGKHYLRFAEVEKALEHLEKALGMAATPEDRILLLEQLAVAHLKQAELDNCVAMHGPESCILPLGEKARHANRRGSEAAIARLTQLLELQPGHAKAMWLLTFAHLTLGTEAPEKWRVPLPKPGGDLLRFPNVAPSAGITAVNHAGGAVMDDFDNDGLLDLVTTDCDPSCGMHYWHNDGGGKFTDRGIPGQLGGLNLSHADFDNDGWIDLLVLRGGWMKEDGRIRVSLLRNVGGRFEDVTVKAGLADVAVPTQTAAWGDFDNDGDLDLFIGSEAHPCRLYRNDGGKFVNVAREAGVENGGFTKGCAWGDYDNDGDVDLYVSNYGQANRLYRNDGGKFTDVAAELGVTEPIHSFPCWFFDYDNDGWLDLFVAGYGSDTGLVAEDMLGRENKGERPRLYHNVKGRFEDVTKAMGLWRVWQPMGANFGDLDNDGRLDFYLGTGFPTYDAIVPNVMLRNGGTSFQDVTLPGGFGHVQKGHGVAWGDFDNDGDEDVFIEIGGFYPGDGFRNALFLNPGGMGRSVTLRFTGTKSNRFGVGARVRVTTPTREIHRVVGTGGSFGGNSLQQEIGLGGEKVKSIEVVWPGGAKQVFTDVPDAPCLEVREGEEKLGVRK